VGLAVLLLQLIQPPLLLLVLLSHRAIGVLDSEELPLLLLELAGVVVHLPLQRLQLGLRGVNRSHCFADGSVRLKSRVHLSFIYFLFRVKLY
jgi:hypothetical protein